MRLGGFEVGERLDGGAMGDVYSAVHLRSGFEAAVKFASSTSDPIAFAREVEAVAGLDHPHIVWVLDHGTTDDGVPWLAMQRATGTLREVIGGPWENTRRALLYLLDALAHAHARGVLHGDLKPANILLGCRRDPHAPLRDSIEGLALADFGLARAFDIQNTGGTPGFAAPECSTGGPTGPWTDLYAVGCTAWTLLCGSPPTAAGQRAFRPLVPVPEGVGGWLAGLLHPSPEQRYQRAAAALQALVALPSSTGAPPTSDQRPLPVACLQTTQAVLEAVVRPAAIAMEPLPRRPKLSLPASWQRTEVPWPAIAMLDAGLSLHSFRSPPLVGRIAERDILWAALCDVERTRAQRVVQLLGPAGSGRARLARWLTHRALELGVATVTDHAPDPDVDGLQIVRVHEPRIQQISRSALEASHAILWVVIGGPPVSEEMDCRVVELHPLPPFELEALVRAILPLEPGLSLEVAARSAGWPGKAVDHVRALVANGDLVPSPHGYVLRARPDGPSEHPCLEAELDAALSESERCRQRGDRREAARLARRAWTLVGELGIPPTHYRHVAALAQRVAGGAGTLSPAEHLSQARTLVRIASEGGFVEQEFLGRFQLAMRLVGKAEHQQEMLTQMRGAAQLAEAHGLDDLAVKAWYQLGYEALFEGDTDGAEALFRRCLDVDSRVGRHFGGMGLCEVLLGKGQGEEALASAHDAIEAGLPGRLHEAAGTLGCALIDLGRYTEAEHWMRVGLDAAREVGSTGYEMRMLLNLGCIHQTTGNDTDAERCFLQGIERSRTTGQSDGLCRSNLALIYLRNARYAEAVQLLEPQAATPTGRVELDLYNALLWLTARVGAERCTDIRDGLAQCHAQFASHGKTNPSCIEVTTCLVDLLEGGPHAHEALRLLDEQKNA